MKYLLALLLLLPSTVFASCKYNSLNQLSDRIGVQIHCDYDRDAYFDQDLKSNCKTLHAKKPVFLDINMTSSTIEKFISAYPKGVVSKYLSDIYLLSDLYCGGFHFGGTSHKKRIYVEVYRHTTKDWLLEALHHEMSSTLLDNKASVLVTEIEKVSGSRAYDSDIMHDCLNEGKCRDESPRLFRQGFLVAYNKTTPENDFNVYVEYLFTKREHLMELAEMYPLIDRKVKLIKKFYNDIGVPI